MSGLCVDQITVPFPKYNLKIVEKDIENEVSDTNPSILNKLPQLPKQVGGEVDLMIGKAYMKYLPREIFRMKNGLTLFESVFRSTDGSTGVVCGPHPEFTKVDRVVNFSVGGSMTYYTQSVLNYITRPLLHDIPSFGYEREVGPLYDPDLAPLISENNCAGCEVSSHYSTELGGNLDGEIEVDEGEEVQCSTCSSCLKCSEVYKVTMRVKKFSAPRVLHA